MYLYLDSKKHSFKKTHIFQPWKVVISLKPPTIGSLAKEAAATKQQGVGSKYQGVFSTSTGSIALSRIKGSQSLRKRAFAKLTHPFEADFLFRFKGSKPKRSLVLSWYIRYLSSTGEPLSPDYPRSCWSWHIVSFSSPELHISKNPKDPVTFSMKSWLVPENPLPSFLL